VTSFAVDGVVLDIEGTVSSIDFVYRHMFPFVRRELHVFLAEHFDDPEVRLACQRIADEVNLTQWSMLSSHPAARAEALEKIASAVMVLMDADAKSTGLKQLQGLIWRSGFDSGELVADLYSDVAPQLRQWHAAGIRLFIYSSGSIAAQQLFFGHTTVGDLRGLLSGFFDTTTGPKRESESYRAIARSTGFSPARLLFVSDVTAELAAAAKAGFQCALAIRDGNPPQPDADIWPQIESFDQLRVQPAAA
jgi:enolase-phosphatase E1